MDWLDANADAEEQSDATAVVRQVFELLSAQRSDEAAALFVSPATMAGAFGPPGKMPAFGWRLAREVPEAALEPLRDQAELFDGPLQPDDGVVLVDVRLDAELTLGAVVGREAGQIKVRRFFDPRWLKEAGLRLGVAPSG